MHYVQIFTALQVTSNDCKPQSGARRIKLYYSLINYSVVSSNQRIYVKQGKQRFHRPKLHANQGNRTGGIHGMKMGEKLWRLSPTTPKQDKHSEAAWKNCPKIEIDMTLFYALGVEDRTSPIQKRMGKPILGHLALLHCSFFAQRPADSEQRFTPIANPCLI